MDATLKTRTLEQTSSFDKNKVLTAIKKNNSNSSTFFFKKRVKKSRFEYNKEILEKFAFSLKYREESLKIIAIAFENQRKMYKYAKAWNSYQNEYISDSEMDLLEEKLKVSIDNSIPFAHVNTMIKVLFENIKEDDFDIEELSTILGVSREHIRKISIKTNTEMDS